MVKHGNTPLKDLTEDQTEYIKIYPIYWSQKTWDELKAAITSKAETPLTNEQATFLVRYYLVLKTGEGIPSPENAPRAVAELKDQLDAMGPSKRRR